MKKLILILLILINIFANEDKISKLTTDDTLASWERKAILFTKDTGLGQQTIRLDITYCYPSKQQRQCYNKGFYDFKITQSIKNNIDNILWNSLIKNRYDKIVFTENSISIITPAKTINTNNEQLTKPSLKHNNITEYKNSIYYFLNEIKKPIADVLKESIDQRYIEMNNQEKESFFTQKAKSSGIPIEFITKLMNASFSFSVYSYPIQGSITINKYISKREGTHYETSISINNRSTLFINKLNTHKEPINFDIYKEIKIHSSNSKSLTNDYYPSNNLFRTNIENSIISLYKNMASEYSYKLIEDDNFAITNPISSVNNNRVYSNIGFLEDVRIDAPYIIRKTVNGEIKENGFVKNRVVFDNSYNGNEQNIGNSEFDIIRGSADIISSLKEHPWNGTFFSIGGGVFAFETDNLFFKSKTVNAINIGASADLGYITNDPSLSEIWFLASFLIGATDNKVTNKNMAVMTIKMALSNRFYFKGSGLYITPTIGFGGSFASTDTNIINNIQIGSVDLHTGGEIGFSINPNNGISFYMDYDIPMYTFMQTNEVDFTSDDDFVNRGLSFGFVYKKHI